MKAPIFAVFGLALGQNQINNNKVHKAVDREDFQISSSELSKMMNGREVEKKWVFHHETGLTWLEAAADCRRAGGVLAYFDDARDHIAALKMIPMDARFWLGYSDKAIEGLWKTISNEMPQYMRWIDQQPDDRLNNEDCALAVMGSWGRGRMMDADCDSRTGIPEWGVKVGHLCRIDSAPDLAFLELMEEDTSSLDLPELEEEDEEDSFILPQDRPVPKWAMMENEANIFVDEEMANKIDKAAELIPVVNNLSSKMKKSAKEDDKIQQKFKNMKEDFSALEEVTKTIRKDNKFIFEQLDLLRGQSTEDSMEKRAEAMRTSADMVEEMFWIDKQRSLNAGFSKALEQRKEDVEMLEEDIFNLRQNITELAVEDFMIAQEEENEYLRQEVARLAYTNVSFQQTLKAMTKEFEKIYGVLHKLMTSQQEAMKPHNTQGPQNPQQGAPIGAMRPSPEQMRPAPQQKPESATAQSKAPGPSESSVIPPVERQAKQSTDDNQADNNDSYDDYYESDLSTNSTVTELY